MKTSVLRIALALSVLVNLGVVGALGYRAIQQHTPPLVRQLGLDAAQLQHWRELESGFLARLDAESQEIERRRNRLVDLIFASSPDEQAIEAERAAIAQLQERQQRLVIEQLQRESAMLEAAQRERLAQVLKSQPAAASGFEQLHRD